MEFLPNSRQYWSDFFQNINSLLVFCGRVKTLSDIEISLLRIEDACTTLQQILPLLAAAERDFISNVLLNFEEIRSILIRSITHNQWFPPGTVAQLSECQFTEISINPGRPKILIPYQCLVHLRESGFSWNKIAMMYGVSKWTIFRRAKEFNLDEIPRFSEITDEELNRLVTLFCQEHGDFVGFTFSSIV